MMKLRWLWALVIPAVAAADSGDEWYVSGQGGGIWPDYKRQLSNQDWLYGIGIGHELGPIFNLEFNANGARIINRTDSRHYSGHGYSLDLLALANRDGMFAPYLSLGAGALREDYGPAPGRTNFMAQGGVGLMWTLWRNATRSSSFALRPEVKVRFDDPGHDGHFIDYLGVLGFQFSFGGAVPTPPVAAPPPPPPPPPPAPSPVVSAGPPEPTVAPVVPPRPRRVTLSSDASFAFGSATVRPEGIRVLDQFAKDLHGTTFDHIRVTGYTDRIGSSAYNLRLSEQRAEAVKAYLVQSGGIDSSLIVAEGMGKSNPVTKPGECGEKRSPATVACLQPDRRVELEVSATTP